MVLEKKLPGNQVSTIRRTLMRDMGWYWKIMTNQMSAYPASGVPLGLFGDGDRFRIFQTCFLAPCWHDDMSAPEGGSMAVDVDEQNGGSWRQCKHRNAITRADVVLPRMGRLSCDLHPRRVVDTHAFTMGPSITVQLVSR